MGKLQDKVALISGVARGQGRAHAVGLAREGADIIGFDICAQKVDAVAYPLASPEDLAETIDLVKAEGGRIVAEQADVRDPAAIKDVVAHGLGEFGHIDIVLANAGVMTMAGPQADSDAAWFDSIDVMLSGVFNTVRAVIPHMVQRGQGGAIVITSSTAGLKGMGSGTAGSMGYTASKHGVVGLMRALANDLAPHSIRVNTVHPTGTNTPMVINETFMQFIGENQHLANGMQNLLPVPLIEPDDVTNAILWLVSDAARYVTGVTLPVDAGFAVR